MELYLWGRHPKVVLVECPNISFFGKIPTNPSTKIFETKINQMVNFRYLLLLAYCCCYTTLSQACSAAYQYSLFPLGSSQGRLVFLEVELNRYLTTPNSPTMRIGGGGVGLLSGQQNEVEVRWKGTFKLMLQQGDSLEIQQELDYVDVLDKEYATALRPSFEKAYQAAITLPYFEEAILESVAYCSYELDCGWMQLSIDTAHVILYARSTEKGYDQDSCRVKFKVQDLLKVEKNTTIPFSDFDNVDKEFQINFLQLWSPQAVRRYTIDGRTLQVYSIGRGSRSRYTPLESTEKRQQPMLEDIGHFVQGNDVLFHGQRFDVWDWVE